MCIFSYFWYTLNFIQIPVFYFPQESIRIIHASVLKEFKSASYIMFMVSEQIKLALASNTISHKAYVRKEVRRHLAFHMTIC